MPDSRQARAALVTRILESDGRASRADRRAAFDNAGLDAPVSTLIDKVAQSADTITDADFAAAKAAGLDEDQIFELVVCAAVGEASRQYASALAALTRVTQTKE